MSTDNTTAVAMIVYPASRPPELPTRVLLLAFEWVGLAKDKPENPQWYIRWWDGKAWEKFRYSSDTGGYENFQPIAWMQCPVVDPVWVRRVCEESITDKERLDWLDLNRWAADQFDRYQYIRQAIDTLRNRMKGT